MTRQLPVLPIALCVPSLLLFAAHYGFGMQTQALFFAWIVLPIGIVLGIGEWWLCRWAAANRVTVDIKPNLICIQGEEFPFDFSGRTQLIASKGNLAVALDHAMEKAIVGKRRFMLKTDALVQAWPTEDRLTDLEREALVEVVGQRFNAVEIVQCREAHPGSGMSFIDLAPLEGKTQ